MTIAVFRFAASLKQGTEFVFSFVPPNEDLDGEDLRGASTSAARTGALGEPWRTRLSYRDLPERLRRLGFRDVILLTPDTAHRRYLTGHGDTVTAPGWEQNLAAVL